MPTILAGVSIRAQIATIVLFHISFVPDLILLVLWSAWKGKAPSRLFVAQCNARPEILHDPLACAFLTRFWLKKCPANASA